MSKKGPHILVVDDDPDILASLRGHLRQQGYEVYTAPEGEEALEIIAQHRIDLVVLDMILPVPGMQGLEICKRVRECILEQLPIIILSVKGGEDDIVKALTAGADDYVSKPFSIPEVLARIAANLRRVHPTGPIFSTGPLRVDFSRQSVQVNEQEVKLTPIEYQILEVFIKNRNRIVTPVMLLDFIWEDKFGITSHNVYVHIHSLRKKIPRRFITTLPRIGYRFKTDD